MTTPNSEMWKYRGLYLLKGGKKLGHMWVDPGGKELLFGAKRERYSIGSTYAVKVDRTGGGVTLHGKPSWHERGDAPVEWVAESRGAEATIERHRAEKRAKGDAGMDALTIGEARAILAKQLPHQRAGTLAAVLLALGVR